MSDRQREKTSTDNEQDDLVDFAVEAAMGIGELVSGFGPTYSLGNLKLFWIVAIVCVEFVAIGLLLPLFTLSDKAETTTTVHTETSDRTSVAVPIERHRTLGPMVVDIGTYEMSQGDNLDQEVELQKTEAVIIDDGVKEFAPVKIPQPNIVEKLTPRLQQWDVEWNPEVQQNQYQPQTQTKTETVSKVEQRTAISTIDPSKLIGPLNQPLVYSQSVLAGYTQPRQFWCGFTPFTARICDANPLVSHYVDVAFSVIPVSIEANDDLVKVVYKAVLTRAELTSSPGTDYLLWPLAEDGRIAQQTDGQLNRFVQVSEVSIEQARNFAIDSACSNLRIFVTTETQVRVSSLALGGTNLKAEGKLSNFDCK